MSISLCEDCVYYSYDEESDSYYCDEQLDEDEMASFLRGKLCNLFQHLTMAKVRE